MQILVRAAISSSLLWLNQPIVFSILTYSIGYSIFYFNVKCKFQCGLPYPAPFCGLTITYQQVTPHSFVYSPTISLFFLLETSSSESQILGPYSLFTELLSLIPFYNFTYLAQATQHFQIQNKKKSALHSGARQRHVLLFSKLINGISYFKCQNIPKQKKHIQAKNINSTQRMCFSCINYNCATAIYSLLKLLAENYVMFPLHHLTLLLC